MHTLKGAAYPVNGGALGATGAGPARGAEGGPDMLQLLATPQWHHRTTQGGAIPCLGCMGGGCMNRAAWWRVAGGFWPAPATIATGEGMHPCRGIAPPPPGDKPPCPPTTSPLVEGYTPPQYAQNGTNCAEGGSPRSIMSGRVLRGRNTQPRIDTPF